jgi:predicted CXXCH cytochrome family protein
MFMRFKSFFIASTIIFGCTQLSNGQSIVGSKHDFSLSANSWNFSTPVTGQLQGQICLPCHAPHRSKSMNDGAAGANSLTSATNAPLWDHQITQATFTVYSGYRFAQSGATVTQTQPDGSSKLCLSCHDGTVALANFKSSMTGTQTMSTFNGGAANLGTDLSTTHPISFVYDAAMATTTHKLWDPTSTASGVKSGTIQSDMLENNKVQCISCHDPHNSAGGNHLLVKSNVGSALCFTCHKL